MRPAFRVINYSKIIKGFGCRLFSKRRRSLKLFEKSFTKKTLMLAGCYVDWLFKQFPA
ncbi:hypothetical protein SXCC_02102 [Gluconacetobacter sp. SXCC-1]|nr:hypothetical protein SXCC_02102 [Gluconacetobacter sp. SXCC-1]